jgi:hypothetical protein
LRQAQSADQAFAEFFSYSVGSFYEAEELLVEIGARGKMQFG